MNGCIEAQLKQWGITQEGIDFFNNKPASAKALILKRMSFIRPHEISQLGGFNNRIYQAIQEYSKYSPEVLREMARIYLKDEHLKEATLDEVYSQAIKNIEERNRK